ncbi:hypothetical protein [Lactococcus petauri]|uniref:hypothetical protein n=1 Tax=Lactococcus petauri TaxID=1940789 RepID=UPI0020786C7C|nr:hypothetical protein [Lactococcus petauri]USI67612.1 hypothetical protein LMK04_08970 [Lactococcus petauri]
MTNWFDFSDKYLIDQLVKTYQYLVTSASTQSQWTADWGAKQEEKQYWANESQYPKRRDYIIEKKKKDENFLVFFLYFHSCYNQ